MDKGILYWITGLSGAGKTTLGNRLYYRLKQESINVVILDGDILKEIIARNGYEQSERLERAYRYSALCKLLTDQGIHVIMCTIAMFDEIRNWNRKNIDKYVEVFLDVTLETLQKRNKKGLYSLKENNVVGLDVAAEYPKDPDIVIRNHDNDTLDESVERILNYQVVSRSEKNSYEKYWNEYYASNNNLLSTPSLFAREIFSKYMEKGKNVIELGCGNGRDSLYFARNGLYVTGIDSSQVAISQLCDKINDGSGYVSGGGYLYVMISLRQNLYIRYHMIIVIADLRYIRSTKSRK